MKTYKVSLTVEVYVVADNEDDAIEQASDWGSQHDLGEGFAMDGVAEESDSVPDGGMALNAGISRE